MNIRIILAACVAVLAAGTARADAIDDEVARIVSRNPALAAEKARLDADLDAALADNSLSGPEIEFDYKFGKFENRWGGGVSQSFDWPGVYAARRNANRARRSAFEQLYRANYLERALEAKQMLVSLARARAVCDVVTEAENNIRRLSELYESALERGETTVLEVRKLRLRAFELACRRAEAEAEVESVEASLAALNGGEPVGFAATFPHEALAPEAQYLQAMMEADPTVAASARLVAVADGDVSVACRSALPTFSVGYAYENEGGESFHGFAVGLSLPTWSNSRRTASARAARLAAGLEASDYALMMRARLASDYAAASRLGVRLDAGRRDFATDDYPQLLRKALDSGRITLFDYLGDYNDYLSAKSAYIDLEYRYASLLASLNRYNLLK